MLIQEYSEITKEDADPRIERYIQTKTMQRLQGKGVFCGMDYVNIDKLKPIEYYSRLEHSKNVAYTTSSMYRNSRDEIFKVVLAFISQPKIRQCNPLIVDSHLNLCEIDGIAGNFYRELNPLGEAINLTYKPISGNLSDYTVKTLSKYMK